MALSLALNVSIQPSPIPNHVFGPPSTAHGQRGQSQARGVELPDAIDDAKKEKDYYFAFADAAFSRAELTMSFNFPFSARTLNRSTTKGT